MEGLDEIFEAGGVFDGHYRLLEPLSTEGGSADVWLAVDLNTAEEDDYERATKVAIKIYRPQNMIDIEGEYRFRKEFKQVFGCHHANIIQPTYFNIYRDMPYLVLPYCPAGSSELLVGSLNTEKDLWKYIYEVASGLAYLHEHSPQIIHQDIKPANVLIDDNGNYAITDFGISAEISSADDEEDEEKGGTLAYMAPERFDESTPPMAESDIWALGATLYELITGDTPFGNDGGSRQERGVLVPAIKEDVPESVKQLIYQCLDYEPANRPTARGIVDTVLKKRYSRGRKTWLAIAGGCLIAVGVILWILFGIQRNDPLAHYYSLAASGDSIIALTLPAINLDRPGNDKNYGEGLEHARLLYSEINKDAPDDFEAKEEIEAKTEILDRLIDELEKYESAVDLAEKARLTEMEEERAEYTVVASNHKKIINQLILKLQ